MSDDEETRCTVEEEEEGDDIVQLPDYANALPPNSLKRVLVQASHASAIPTQTPMPTREWISLIKRVRKNIVHLERHLHDTSHIILALQAATSRLEKAKLMVSLASANNTVVAEVEKAPSKPPNRVEQDAEHYSRSGVSFFRGGVVVPRDFAIGLDEETDRDAIIFSVSIVLPKFVDIIYDLEVFVYGLGTRDDESTPSALFRIGHNAFEKSNLVRDKENKCWRATLLRTGISFIHVPYQIVDLILPLGLQYDLNDWHSLQQNISVRYRYSATMLGAREREFLMSKPFLVPDKYKREWIFNNGAASLLFANDKSDTIEDAETGTDGWPTLTAAEYAVITGDPKEIQKVRRICALQVDEEEIERLCALREEEDNEKK